MGRVSLLMTVVVSLSIVASGCTVDVPTSGPGAKPAQGGASGTASPGNVGRVEARVTQVLDGFTIAVSIGGQTEAIVRYLGAASVESRDPRRPTEAVEEAIATVNGEMVAGKEVFLEKDVTDQDERGRLLRYVFLADGTFVNRELVAKGFARAAPSPPDTKYQEMLRASEQEARQASRGIWGPVEAHGPMETLPLVTPTP